MNCPYCNAENEAGSTFCRGCGRLLQEDQQEATQPTSPADQPAYPLVPPPPPPPKRRSNAVTILLIVVAFVLIGSGVVVFFIYHQNQTATQNANATSIANAQTQTTNNNSTATVQAHLNATATAQVQANATGTAEAQATATAAALPAIPSAKDCVYKYWSTGVNMQVTLTNFGVPTGCVLVSDSVQGELTREDIANSTPTDWSQGGVMAFPEGVYSGSIYNGEYEIVPKTADPNPKQVFCNRVQQVVTNHYAFSQAQPLPEWGLPPGKQIVALGHC